MANTNPTSPPRPQNTIVLRCDSLGEKYIERRVAAGKTVTPGMLCEATSTDGDWQPHSTAAGFAEKVVAVELALAADVPGRSNSTGTIDDAYQAGEVLRLHECQPGDETYALLAASAAAVVRTDFGTSAGDGTIKKAGTTDQRLCKFLENVDNSAGIGTARVAVRWL